MLCRSVERMITYAGLAQEAPTQIPETAPTQPWPNNGVIEFKYALSMVRRSLV